MKSALSSPLEIEKSILFPLVFSLVFFVRKGIQYALIGSFVPLVAISLVLAALSYTCLNSRSRAFRLTLKIWSSLLIMWSIIRLFLATYNTFIDRLSEHHLNQQFGFSGTVVSLLIMIMAIYILTQIRKKQKNS